MALPTDSRHLTGLRGLAALLVVLSHLGENGLGFEIFARSGRPAVALFFMLSGWLMAALYLSRPWRSELGAFLAARAARIAPLFLVVLGLCWALTLLDLFQWRINVSPGNFVLACLFVAAPGSVLWTVPVEVHYYLLFCLLWRLRESHGRRVFALAAVALAALLWTAAMAGHLGDPGERPDGLPFWTPYFIAGSLLGGLSAGEAAALQRAWLARRRLLVPLLAAAALFAMPSAQEALWGYLGDAWISPAALVGVPALFLLALLEPRMRAALRWPPLLRFGEISYAFYLLHIIPLQWARAHLAGQGPAAAWLGAGLTVAATWIAASASTRFFETPARAWLRRRLAEGLQRSQAASRSENSAATLS